MNENNAVETIERVYRRLEEPLQFGNHEVSGYWWIAILVPVLLLGFFYVAWMYVRDGRSVGWPWALLLGLLRCSVYLFLAWIFLLPAYQHWEQTNTRSRALLLFDVSASQDTREGTPSDSMPVEKLPTRLDQVQQLLGSEQVNFIKRLTDKNPVFAYRFGRLLDEDYVVFDENATWTRQKWEERKKHRKLKPSGGAEPTSLGEEEEKPKLWDVKDWAAWFRPDLKAQPPLDADKEALDRFTKRQDYLTRLIGGTNLGESVRTGLNREVGNMLQGVVVFSDGKSTEGTDEAFRELAERAARAEVPIFVVAVGEDRPRVKIEIADVRVPDQARPDDRFKTAVEVTGEGLADKELNLSFDVTRQLVGKNDKKTPAEIVLVETKTNGTPTGKVINLGPKVTLKPETPPTYKPGEPPRSQVEFDIDPQALAKAAGRLADLTPGGKYEFEVSPDGDSEDELVFEARVPKDRREIFVPAEHKSDKVPVKMVKRPLRVLIVTGGAQRDYQFTRTLLVREAQKRRAELSIYLQPAPGQSERRPGIVADVPPERLLSTFPDKLQDESQDKPDEKYYNLAGYDCILAFDPDWTRLNPQQIALLERWVGTHGGGLVVVGGPVNTIQLARPGANRDKLNPILNLYPVMLQDARIIEERTASDPWRLNFPGASPEMEFLNLEEEKPGEKMLSGWDEFFYGATGGKAGVPLQRGIFNYYPVERAKVAATVIGTFSDPRARLQDLKEQPYLVSHNYGAGKVVWIGSGETWRLRQYREAYHERFWTKLCRYVSSGSTGKINKRILPQHGKEHPVNSYVRIDAQMYGRDMNVLPQNSKPKLRIKPPIGSTEKETEVVMTPRPGGDWNGYFTTRVLVKSPGEYNLEFKVEETGDTAPSKFNVKEVNPETDDTRPDVDRLYWLASDASKVLKRVDERTQKELRERLVRPRLRNPDKAPPDVDPDHAKEGQRLYFDLQSAELIPSCMITEEKEQRSRGAVVDLWDKGPMLDVATTIRVLQILTIVLGLGFAVLGLIALVQWASGQGNALVNYVLLVGIVLIAVAGLWVFFRWYQTTFAENASLSFGQNFLLAIALLVIVGLLSLEWFIRKMLRLA